MPKEYNSLKEVEADLQNWFNYRDHLIQNKKEFEFKYWEWAMQESTAKITYLHATRNQWIDAGQL
jgi:hypothetical protein|tara:strand:- start:879 stop:1073 length:195 start_codon:yes stop_codon:yes gene_type:complete